MGDNTIFFKKKTVAVVLLLFFVSLVFSQEAQTQSESTVENLKSQETQYVFGNASSNNADTATNDTVNAQGGSSNSSTSSTIMPFINMILVLVAVIACIYGIVWLIKKSMRPGAENDPYLKKTASITLAPGKTVQIVTLQDKAYLLGVSDTSITLISEIDDKEFVDAMNLNTASTGGKRPADFASLLSSLTGSAKRTERFLKSKRENFGRGENNR